MRVVPGPPPSGRPSGQSRRRTDSGTIRIVIVGDDQLVSDGLALVLGGRDDFEVCGHAGSVADAVPLARASAPDVVVMDFHLPDGTGLDAVIAIRRVQPRARFVFLSGDDSESAWLAAVEAGAGAFIHKSRAASDVIDAVRRVGNGESLIPPALIASLLSRRRELDDRKDSLSAREREVLQLMSDGASSREIAQRLGISYATVRSHIRSLSTKLGAHSKIEAIAAAREMRIIE